MVSVHAGGFGCNGLVCLAEGKVVTWRAGVATLRAGVATLRAKGTYLRSVGRDREGSTLKALAVGVSGSNLFPQGSILVVTWVVSFFP